MIYQLAKMNMVMNMKAIDIDNDDTKNDDDEDSGIDKIQSDDKKICL